MKFRKMVSLAMAAIMATSAATIAANAVTIDSDTVSYGSYYNGSYLESYASAAYNESNLGATYSKASTTFKTWSPDASSVKVKIYATGSDSESGAGVIGTYDLTKNSTTGVWSTTVSGDLKNKYYTYIINVKGSTNETQDVYSKAAGVNGNRSMIVDLDSTDPQDWDSDKHVLFDSASEAVVWEVHVRDFSASSTSGVSEQNQGKYLAFTEGGTTLNSDTSANAVSTGIDYLVEQGINCVQLMPVYDFASVDESIASSSSNRNWGYDPQNYNVPEGSYSSNPYDGNTRITEFKQMIQALHDRGISVVMDVVYNHTYSTDSCFNRTVPGYYYRMTSSSAYSNGSGCGNETASDKLMYRKYMIESIKYWAEEYHIDGFRFDLMGIHDIDTMNAIRSALDGLYSDGSGKKILMYGEPWTGGTVAISDGCTQSKASSLDSRVGMFCDSYRDAIKGGTDDATKGFVQGNNDKTGTVVNGVKGKGFSAKAPSQTIAYADAHDNLILWDKIVKSNGSTSWDSTSSAYKGQMQEVMGLILTSQGIPFMTAGSEFCRTKQGDHNSYKSSDSINNIDWTRVSTYADVAAYYKGLLQIRENYTPMKSSTFNTPTFQSEWGYVVAYTYSNNKSNEWGKVCVLVNSGTQAYSITLDGSGWTVVADGKTAGLKSLGTVSGNTYSVPARSACVLVQSSTFGNLNADNSALATLSVKHVDENGKVLKTANAKYRAGSTYRALPDASILYDYVLVGTTGSTSGKVEAGKTYNVTFTYKSSGIESGYLTVKYVDSNGKSIKESMSTRMRAGDSYEVPATAIMGYQLDTDKYPAESYGTFTGSDKTITFTYKNLDSSSVTVHYYNSNSWSSIRMYTYADGGKEPNGAWDSATLMTSEGNNWYKAVVPASCAYAMFHPSSGSGQEPGQGQSGYLVAGDEVWIQNGTVKFNSTVITSHISASTGRKLVADVVDSKTSITSSSSYTTTALSGRTDVVIPINATGNYTAGITNVVYIYTDGSVIPTTSPITTSPVTTAPQTTVQPRILIGDVNLSDTITVDDATLLQKYIAQLSELSSDALIAADCDEDGYRNIMDVTLIQKYLAGMKDYGKVGTYKGSQEETTVPQTTAEPTTAQPTTSVQPTTAQPTTAQPTTKASTYTMTLTNNYYWSKVYCYYWSDANKGMVTWPGPQMTYSEKNDYNQDIYTIEIPSTAQYVIFSDGSGTQTVDIPITGSTRFYISGGSGKSCQVSTW
ncbi:MAG: type I pullulanase [Ruminococcus sp.]|nr:type I pullulanase [Ruminococcus sp.]